MTPEVATLPWCASLKKITADSHLLTDEHCMLVQRNLCKIKVCMENLFLIR